MPDRTSGRKRAVYGEKLSTIRENFVDVVDPGERILKVLVPPRLSEPEGNMEGATPPVPSAETVDTAYKSIIEFGVVGAILVINLTCCITLVWWVLHSSRKRIEKVEDDAKVRVNTVETQSTERALAYREIIKQKDDQLERFETRLNDVQEKRVGGMEIAVGAVTKMNERTGRIMGMLKAVLDQLNIEEGNYSDDSDSGGAGD